jgi:hypothetical protein
MNVIATNVVRAKVGTTVLEPIVLKQLLAKELY